MEKKLEADIKNFLKGSAELSKLGQKIAEIEKKLGPQAQGIMDIPIGPALLGGFFAVLAIEIIEEMRQQNPGLFKDETPSLLQAYDIIKGMMESWNEERE